MQLLHRYNKVRDLAAKQAKKAAQDGRSRGSGRSPSS
jgi:hypothetical protein